MPDIVQLPNVITAGGQADLCWFLRGRDGSQELESKLTNSQALVSIRKASSSRLEHQVVTALGTVDSTKGTVTLDLTPAQTELLGPPDNLARQAVNECLGDVRIEGGGRQPQYYGPFSFSVRLPETYISGSSQPVVPVVTPVNPVQPTGIGNTTYVLFTPPLSILGVDGDVALVRKSSIQMHAYLKTSGIWNRIWQFSGGDTVFLFKGAAVADSYPATPTDATFTRIMGISGYAPITLADINQVSLTGNALTTVAQMRGGHSGNTVPFYTTNTISFSRIVFNYSTVPVYIFWTIEKRRNRGLSLASVSQGGVDIPIVKNDDLVVRRVDSQVYRTVSTYTKAEIDSADFVLTLAQDPSFPANYNRYAVVTQNAVPTAAEFNSSTAYASGTPSIHVPNKGWVSGMGYLHFALPATQDAPTIAGKPGGINLIDDFTVRSRRLTIEMNGEDMRTISSNSLVFESSDTNPWIIR